MTAALEVRGFMNVMAVGNDGALYRKWDAMPLWSGPTALTATGYAPPDGNLSAANFHTALDTFLVVNNGGLDLLTNTGFGWAAATVIAATLAEPGAEVSGALQTRRNST